MGNQRIVKKITAPEVKARQAADLISDIADDRDALLVMWHAIDEPAREAMLAYFAEWDTAFCEALNPVLP